MAYEICDAPFPCFTLQFMPRWGAPRHQVVTSSPAHQMSAVSVGAMPHTNEITLDTYRLLVQVIDARDWRVAADVALMLINRLQDVGKPVPRGVKHVSVPAGNLPGVVYNRVAMINTLIDQRRRKK